MNRAQKNLVRRLIGNAAALSITQMARVGFSAILSLVIARQLGASGFGKYGVLTAYLHIFQVLATAGVPRLVIRGIAREPQGGQVWFHRTVVNQVLNAAISAAMLVFLVNILDHPADTTRALEIAAIALLPFALLSAVEVVFRAREQMGFITLTQTAAIGAQTVGGLFALLTGQGIIALAWMVVIGQSVAAVLGFGIAKRMRLWEGFRVDLKEAVLLTRRSLDFFLVSLSVVVFSRLDVLILAQMVGEEAVGLYNAAYLIVRVVNFVSVSYSDAAYPVLSRLFSEARESFESLLRRSLLLGTTVTLLIAILLAVVADPIINILYQGQEYAVSAGLLRIEAPFIVIFIWNALLSNSLMAGDLQRRSAVVSGAKLGAGLIYYLVLTAWLGVTGTAIATVTAGFSGTALNYFFLNRELHSLDPMSLVAKPLMAGAILVGALWLARGAPWPALVAGGVVLYLFLLILFRVFSREDVRLLAEVVKPL